MKSNKTLIAASAVLFCAGVAAIALMKNEPEKVAPSAAQPTRKGPSSESASPPTDASPSTPRPRTRETVKNPDLVSTYGESRTNLSKHISGNVISLLEDAVQMGEMMTSGQMGGGFGGRGGMGMALGRTNNDLQLSDEQKEKAAKMYADFQKRQIANSKTAIERLKKDPTSLMKLMLASDASSRGDIQDDEYKRLQTETGKDLMGVMNPLDRNNFGGGKPLQDEAFLSEYQSILDPSQIEKLQATLAQQKIDTPEIQQGNIANLPKMELEKLDTSIESAKKITTGLKSMMDGFGGLKDLVPPPPPSGQN
jgi:hypothetical protein